MSKMYINQYLNINTENPFSEKFHLLKKSLSKLEQLKISSKKQTREMEGILMSLLPIRSQRQ